MSDIPTLPPCPICGKPIPPKIGMPRKTCSEECRKKRAAQMESARYEKVKGTDEWKMTRAGYIKRVAQLKKQDAAYAEKLLSAQRRRVAQHRQRLISTPEGRARYLAAKRDAWRLRATPERRVAWREKNRAWYRSLSSDQRERIYYAPRRWLQYRAEVLQRLEAAAEHYRQQAVVNMTRAHVMYRHWESWEISLLREQWHSTHAKTIATRLRRSTQAVTLQAMKLGLKAVPGRGLGGAKSHGRRVPWPEFGSWFSLDSQMLQLRSQASRPVLPL